MASTLLTRGLHVAQNGVHLACSTPPYCCTTPRFYPLNSHRFPKFKLILQPPEGSTTRTWFKQALEPSAAGRPEPSRAELWRRLWTACGSGLSLESREPWPKPRLTINIRQSPRRTINTSLVVHFHQHRSSFVLLTLSTSKTTEKGWVRGGDYKEDPQEREIH
ncbi:hypothetical protein BDN70DRAFT_921492 [Pholiota conissans]|uniref:Uncharacterized protein n=1 Tax=Pholiota conissans TaxID=109636 RepID=A0A9P6D063_9AGAR|nr:hypothetical protein BDN70DRAFT_921492 [Pholiota conissans]